jgi:C_GCAxxG_C_C family probable redox protein
MVLAVGGHMLGEEAAKRCVRWATGFAAGVGNKQEMCGALSGGVMVIGGLYGRDHAEQEDQPCRDAAARYRGRFLDAFGVTQCEPLYDQMHSADGTGSCSLVVERAARILLEVLAEARRDAAQ